MWIAVTLIIVFGCIKFAFDVILPPSDFPKSIPTIPFYVTFISLFYDMDQEEVFDYYLKEKLETYGAVKIYFGSRWNILVSRPAYLATIFKDETLFAKSGNQKKISYSVLADYTGDNIISAHGATWKLYHNTLSNGLQHFPVVPLAANAKSFVNLIEKEGSMGVSVLMPELIQKLTLANISQCMLGFDFGTLSEVDCVLHNQLKQVKREIFKPLYLNFPWLDKLPIPSRIKARKQVKEFKKHVVSKVYENLLDNYKFEESSFAASSLVNAYVHEDLTEKQLIDNIVILLVAGHENPQLLLTTLLYVLAKYPEWQTKLRTEVKVTKDMNGPVMNSILFETVRLYPPLGQIINRCTTKTASLGDHIIPKGVYVGYNVYGTGRFPSVWGVKADQFLPERWGNTNEEIMSQWKHRKLDCSISGFHGGKRACLGEKFALYEMKVVLAELVNRLEWSLSPNWKEKMTPAGPLCPLGLQLQFKEV